jgi:transposase
LCVQEVDRLGRNLLEGKVGGRRPVVDDKRAAILDRRRGESIRTIAAGVKVSIGVVHKTIAEAQAENKPADHRP